MERAVSPRLTILTMASPEVFPRRNLSADTARAVAANGRVKPTASARHCMVLAVPMMGQAPGEGCRIKDSPE